MGGVEHTGGEDYLATGLGLAEGSGGGGVGTGICAVKALAFEIFDAGGFGLFTRLIVEEDAGG